jgi:creatinine amidohydrolase
MGDYALAEAFALKIAGLCRARNIPIFVAPTLPFGVADHFGSSPGGMAISAASFRSVLNDLLAALLRHKLTRIIILNGHGGNVPVIHEGTLAIKLSGGPVIPSLYLWKICRALMERHVGAAQQKRFGHGGEPLLSLTMALRPEYVVLDDTGMSSAGSILGLGVTDFGTIMFEDMPVDIPAEFSEVPHLAVQNAKLSASEELGQIVAEEMICKAANFVEYFVTATK